jgi:hypothetical protein
MLFPKNVIAGIGILFLPILVMGQDALNITQQLISNVTSLKTLQFTLESKERLMKGKFHIENSSFKINESPFKVYIYQHSPKEGLQCLFVSDKNNDKVRINPNSFPWVNLNLEPENELMLQDRHHTIFDGGFSYTISLLDYLLKKYQAQKENLVVLNGIEKIRGIDCYHLTFSNSNYRLTLYTVQSKETPLSIAKKLHLNFYSILENNPSLKVTSVIKSGTKIIVPNDYASKMEFYIHKDKMYPVYLKVFDNKGLYEEYTFTQVILDPVFKDVDFSDKNPAYKF